MAGGNTDTRIVKLQFENREFERNIAKSTKSVEELKEAMDFEETSKGLGDFASALGKLDFSRFEENLQRLTDKFTGLGDIGEYVLSRIRNAIESAAREVEYFIRDLSTAQISVGQGKYDQMNKAVMTIVSSEKATEDQAYTTMERIMAYTDQTSHSFNTMVGQLSNLTSIGYDLNEGERLLEGIGNAATFAGQGAENAAVSMGVLTKSLGPDTFLSYEKFLQLSQTARVITDKWRQQALEAGVAVGTLVKKNDKYYTNVKGQKKLEVTASGLENTLKYRWLNGRVLAEIYKNYQFGETVDELAHPEDAMDSFGKTAYLTGQRALTLVDALNAMKESVSSGWMNTFRLIFGDVTEAAEHFTNIADRVIESLERIKDFRNGILSLWAEAGGRKNLFQILLGDYEDDMETGAYGFLDLIDGIGDFVIDGIKDFMTLFMNPAQRIRMKNEPDYFRKWLAGGLIYISREIENFLKRIREFFNADVNINGKTKTRLEVIHDIVMGIAAALKFGYDIVDGIITFISEISGQLTPSFDSIIGFFGDLGNELYGAEQQAGDAKSIKTFFTDLADRLRPVTEGINKIVESITKFLRLLFGLDKETDKQNEKGAKLGDVLLQIADIIAKVLGPTLQFLGSVIELITKLLSGEISFKDFGKKLGESFKEMIKSFVDNLPESFKGFGDWIRDLFGLWEDESQANEKSFATFLHKLFTGSFTNFGEFIGSLTEGFSLKDALENGFGFGAAFNFLNTVVGWFKGTNLYGVLLAFLGVTSLITIIKLINRIKMAITNIGVFFDDVGGNLMQGFTGEYEWFGERILRIAKAVALFAVAVMILGSMDTGRMIQGILGLAAVMGLMFGFIALLNTSVARTSLSNQAMIEAMIITLTASILVIAVALSVLSLAIIPLASDWRKMVTAVLGLAAILAVFGAFIVIMLKQLKAFTFGLSEKDKWNHIAQMAVMLLLLCGAIAILSVAIGALTVALTPLALTGWGGTIRAIVAFTAIMAVFGIFIVLMLKQLDTLAFTIGGTNSWSGIGKMAAMLLLLAVTVGLMAISIGALVVAITPLAVMSWGGFVRAIGGLALILVELGLMIKYLQSISTVDKTVSLKIAGLTAFALSLGILVYALIPLSMMSLQGWAQAMSGLGIVLIELAAMIMFVQKMSTADKTLTIKIAGLAGFAASIGILIFALIPLSMMSIPGIIQALVGLAIVLLELVGFMKLAQATNVTGIALGGFIGFALSIAILIFALKPLAEMTPEGYVRALVGLATVLLEVVVLMAIMKELQPDLKTAASTVMLLIALGASMILFGIAFNEVKDVPVDKMLAFAGGLAVLLVAIAGAAALAKVGGIAGMLILVAGLALIIGVISLLAPLLAGSLANSLKIMAGSLNYMTSMLNSFGETMNQMDEGSAEKGERMIDKLKHMFEKLAGFGSYSASVDAFTTALYDLSTGLRIFQNHTGKIIDPDSNSGMKLINQLAEAAPKLDVLAKTNIDGITSTITGLGGAMMLYAQGAEEVGGLEIGDTPDVTAAVGLLTAISDSLVQNGGFVIPPNMPDEQRIGLFGAQLAALAGALVQFEEAGQGLGTGYKNGKDALNYFKKLKEDLDSDFYYNIQTAIGAFGEGEAAITPSALEEFGKNIEQLGLSLSAFAESTTTVNEKTGEVTPVNYDAAIKALESFETLDTKLSKIKLGGVASWFSGNPQTLSDFGGEIQTLGDNLNSFSASIIGDAEHPGFDPTAADTAIDQVGKMIKFMTDMQKDLGTVGGLANIWNTIWGGRSINMEDLSKEMGHLAEGLGKIGEKLNNKTWADSTGAKNAFDSMDSILSLMIHIQQFYRDMEAIDIVGWTAYSAFAGLSEFIGYFADDENSIVDRISMFMLHMDDALLEWADKKDIASIMSRMEAFKTFTEGLNALASTIDTDRKAGSSWSFIGSKLTGDVATSITEGTESVLTSITDLINGIYTRANNVEGVDWKQIGVNVVDGISTGIDTESLITLWPSVENMMLEAYRRGKAAIDSNSPSKLFMELGSFMGEGTALGIQKSTSDVSESAGEMGDIALNSAQNMIALISRIMAEGTNASPTIAPVLDMSNINEGMALFRDSLDGYGVNLDTSVSSRLASRIGTSGYEDVNAAKPDYSEIKQGMTQIGNQIVKMGQEIRRMKLVLDTGAVAGGVADLLDEEFGRREFYASRE